MNVTIEIAQEIQTAVANRAHQGYEDMEPIAERFIDAGYDDEQVRETIKAGIEELRAVYA